MGTDFAAVAGLLGHPARAAMVDALMSGEPVTAGELARIAGVGPSTASQHLSRLVEGGVVAVEVRGRQRHYRLAGAEVAEALERIALLGTEAEVRRRVAAVNQRIVYFNSHITNGPASDQMPLDVEQVVAGWRERRRPSAG